MLGIIACDALRCGLGSGCIKQQRHAPSCEPFPCLCRQLQDEDLVQLRERREWLDAVSQMKGGVSRSSKIGLRTEARAPFRLPRIVLFGGLSAGAGLGLLVITFRLVKALQGGEGAPELAETVQNFGINSGVLALLLFLLWRDLQTKSRDEKVTEREEEMGRLLLSLENDRVLPLSRMRGDVRPVIIAGIHNRMHLVLPA